VWDKKNRRTIPSSRRSDRNIFDAVSAKCDDSCEISICQMRSQKETSQKRQSNTKSNLRHAGHAGGKAAGSQDARM